MSVSASLLIAAPRTLSLLRSQCVSPPWTIFSTQICSGKCKFSKFVNIVFAKHITHCVVNFTWFALLSQQKFDDRPLFKLGAQFDLLPF